MTRTELPPLFEPRGWSGPTLDTPAYSVGQMKAYARDMEALTWDAAADLVDSMRGDLYDDTGDVNRIVWSLQDMAKKVREGK